MVSDEFKILNSNDEKIIKLLERVDRDLTTDRKRIDDSTLRLGNVENRLNIVDEAVKKQPEKTKDKVEDALAPLEDNVEKLTNGIDSLNQTIKSNKFPLNIKSKSFIRNLWPF